jgi:uroporphyrin-III C-methyltransferase
MNTINTRKKGNLVIVGTGILTPAHLSQESVAQIKSADVVHVLVPDPLGLSTIIKLNDNIKNLADLYFNPENTKNGTNRQEAYDLMVEAILTDVRSGLNVCAIFYGHPGVFVYPSHVSIKRAKQEGYEAQMLPAISAEDCLFADLGVDPGDLGCQAYEASQFMFYKHSINTSAALILWQIGVVGDETLTKLVPSENGLAMLTEKLLAYYPADHKIILYEATTLPIMPPRIEELTVNDLKHAKVKTITTLYIPQLSQPELDLVFCSKWCIDIKQIFKLLN